MWESLKLLQSSGSDDDSTIGVPLIYNSITVAVISTSVLGCIRRLIAVRVDTLLTVLRVQLRTVRAAPRDVISHPITLIVETVLPDGQVRAVGSPPAIGAIAAIA